MPHRNTCPVLLMVCVCGMVSLHLPARTANAQAVPPPVTAAPPAAVTPQAALTPDQLKQDARLAAVFNLDVRGVEIKRTLEAISAQTKIGLTVSPQWQDRRYTGMMRRQTMLSFMLAIARTCRMSWKIQPPTDPAPAPASAPVYVLFQTDEQQQAERRLVAGSERREARFREELKARLTQAVQNALAGGDPTTGHLEVLLQGYSPEQMDRAMDSALEPPDIISASDQSHFHSHFFYSDDFARLSPTQRNAVRSIVGKEQYHPISAGDAEGDASPSAPPDFAAMRVGLIAAAGGFRLGVIEPDGKDVWVSPSVHVGNVPSIDPQAQENDLDPAVEKQLRSLGLVNFGAMPMSLRKKSLVFPPALDRNSLSEFLGSIAGQTGLAFSCDDFLNSRATIYPNILADKAGYTVEEALVQIAKTFGHRMMYAEGRMYADTLTPGLDLRLEPPVSVMRRLSELTETKRKPDIEDTLAFGQCTRAQINCILSKHPIKRVWAGLLLRAIRVLPCLQIYAQLTPEMRASAAKEGLSYVGLSRAQQQIFDTLVNAGLPATNTPTENLQSERFQSERLYVRPMPYLLPGGKSKPGLTFLITGREETPRLRRFTIF